MTDANDMELLRDYDRHGSEAAFAALVARHIHLVYSVALRHTGVAAHAEEITQAVFVILARKATNLRPDTILEGWLHETTRLTALSFLRGERRRQFREQEAYMQSTLPPANDAGFWNQLAPMLDEAVSRLGKKDRDAVMLRFFKDKNLREVAAALDMTEAAAQRRVHRAVEKLRGYFTKRGVTLTATVLTAAISANSVQAAPLGLAATVTGTAVNGALVSGSTLALIKGVLKVMAWTKAKTAILVSTGFILAAGTATVAVVQIEKLSTPAAVAEAGNPSVYPWQAEGLTTNANGSQSIHGDFLMSAKAPPLVEILPTVKAPKGGPGVTMAGSPDEVKRLQFGSTVEQMVMSAYGFAYADYRTIIATLLPKGRYDCINNLSHGATQAFKDAITKKFGITGRIVAMETNVLLLQIKTPYAPGLTPSKPGDNTQDAQSTGPGSKEYHTVGKSFTDWVNFCEKTMQIPVVDRTGLTGNYDVDLKWRWNRGVSEKDAFNQAVLDQLGLELVPSREPVEMLVVEKVK